MRRMKNNRFYPLVMALCIVAGILIGAFYANHFGGNRLNIIGSGNNKLTNLLRIIEDQYVDTTDIDSIVEAAIPQILAELDPHSVYFTADKAEAETEALHGSFSGVGVEFTIREDTVRVENVVPNGPAEHAGILAGDKIVTVDGKPFTGKEITNEEAMKRLKGPKDTKVKIGVLRYGSKEVKQFVITRGEIPQKSITAVYMIDDATGYIRIKNFGETTYAELLIALATLSESGLENLILDLRENGGGYLQSAVQIANEFLPKNKLIVYTQGRRSKRQDYRSDGHGSYQHIPLVVMINEASASSAEILAGALQDNDRATIIGRRSFGKGLVQQEIAFPDKSRVRLTVARYYTPSGRCIQKPYVAGDEDSYVQDIVNRYTNGEFFSEDSIKHTGKAFFTSNGRTVYEGGGITPDIFVAEDTTDVTSYYKQIAMSGLVLQYAYSYTDANRHILKNYPTLKELKAYLSRQGLVEEFAAYAEEHGVKRRNVMIRKSYSLLDRYVKSRIIYNMLSESAWTEYVNEDDEVVAKAKEILAAGEAFPKPPAPDVEEDESEE
ncbi:MAG: S41 family peptidase [Prevotella sp.]|nr:S41 family peptidase [Prevotella sp.]